MNARITTLLVAAAGGLVMAGCIAATDPAAAPAPAPAPAPQDKPPTAAASRFKIDPVHSTIIFRIEHMGVSYFQGRFNQPTGSFVFDAEKPSSASFEISIRTENVDTDSDARDKHLKSQDFFNAKQFPLITFRSTGVQRTGKLMRVTGDLSMHGITRPVAVELEHIGTKPGRSGVLLSGFDGKLTLKRSDFDMKFMIGSGLGDEVTILVGLEGSQDSQG